ncbi:response regulator transcription factor [Thermobrachium celere]|uniref:Stage 0 sporulation protein A homolog n=1 Tax=Thermobrachium celere DSM 8682 TaxID=941824 RepID=R7RQZ6_9CLOT|nr:response regulator [Thermobrachium celere]CDF57680.1 Helix-turn-helix, AraC type:Response regulator receiver [Thermobrachium celere DSM 8682]
MFKIVIVEDEEIIRNGLVFTIDWLSLDCTVVGTASNGLEGLNLIKEHKPDIVITDIKMPVMDGIEMLKEALKHVSFYSIILTSYSEFEYAKQAISLKVYEYILKPIDEDELIKTINNVKQEIKDRIKNKLISNNQNIIDIDSYIINSKDNYYVNQALLEIKNNYSKKISLESISEMLGVSPSYLSRKFKSITSQTFMDILNQYRIKKSIDLLLSGKYRVYEISELVGFGDYKNFFNTFKKYLNISPTEFLKQEDKKLYSR